MAWNAPGWWNDIARHIHEECEHVAKVAHSVDPIKTLQSTANKLAVEYREDNDDGGDYDNCVLVVAASLAAAASSAGWSAGPGGAAVAAALGTGGGIPLAKIACGRVFPKK